ncbi:MAG TPA: group III truncated hemoglobin [Ferruginibacter sp.]|nr:group III truncated hemoglobin [Ferruginibacter sp.]
MDIKPDITARIDIEKFITRFYENVKTDPIIGIIFNEIIPIRWDHHIPLIIDFWETILLDNPVYTNNAMAIHYDINKIYPLQKKHFDAWLFLFNSTLDNMYCGTVADLAKKRAASIASVMQYKMNDKSML